MTCLCVDVNLKWDLSLCWCWFVVGLVFVLMLICSGACVFVLIFIWSGTSVCVDDLNWEFWSCFCFLRVCSEYFSFCNIRLCIVSSWKQFMTLHSLGNVDTLLYLQLCTETRECGQSISLLSILPEKKRQTRNNLIFAFTHKRHLAGHYLKRNKGDKSAVITPPGGAGVERSRLHDQLSSPQGGI